MDSHVRLLVCNTEGTVEELPDYQGPPERDDVLTFLSSKHKFPDGNEHFGHLMRVEAKHWNDPGKKKSILSQIKDSAGHTGLDTAFYDAKNTLQEDALACFQKHNRNPACPDYKTDAKRLMPDTTQARRDVGAAPFRSKTFLCDFCPVRSMVQQAYYDKSGARN